MSFNPNDIFKSTVRGMFESNNQLVRESASKFKTKSGKKADTADLEFALAVLLVDLASCDQEFAPQEYHIIQNGLRRIFGTSKDQVTNLINQANQTLKNLRGSSKFAADLKESLNLEQRQAIMEIVNEVIAADGKEDGFEIYMRHKFMDLLGLPKTQ